MATSEPSSFLAQRPDLLSVADLMRRHLPSPRIDAGFLDWWYLRNPSRMQAIRAARVGDEVVGVSTINACRFSIFGSESSVGMPQNVVVAPSHRGRGLFGALYRESEADMRALGVDTFVTFTNAVSTPIFLQKFGYLRGRAPEVRFLPANPIDLGYADSPRRLTDVSDVQLAEAAAPGHPGIVKDREYFCWRYRGYRGAQYGILGLLDRCGAPRGAAFVKATVKFGVPMTLLMDLWLPPGVPIEAALIQVRRFALEEGTSGVLFFAEPGLARPAGGLLSVSLGNRFTFLVKGADASRTEELSRMSMSLAFGDLDFY